jgi:PRTRC genetic system protein C
MTTQADFFNQAGQEPLIILNAPTDQKPIKRVFVYDNQFFEDPGPEYTIEDVRRFLAQTYPELEQATHTRRTLPDGTEEITFVKVAGEKGSVTPTLVAERLLAGTTPTTIPAIETFYHLLAAEAEGHLPIAQLLAAAPQIEAALHQAEQLAQASERMVARCLALTPAPCPKVPLGF